MLRVNFQSYFYRSSVFNFSLKKKRVIMSRKSNTVCLTKCLSNTTPAAINNMELETLSQLAITCSKLTIKTLELGVEYIQC